MTQPIVQMPHHAIRQQIRAVPWTLAWLSPKEREIVARRCGIDAPAETARVIGQSLGVTAARIRQIEYQAYRKWWQQKLIQEEGTIPHA